MKFEFPLTLALALIVATPSLAQRTGADMTCTDRQGSCTRLLGEKGAEWVTKCRQAGDECRRSGTFVAPYTGTVFSNVPKR